VVGRLRRSATSRAAVAATVPARSARKSLYERFPGHHCIQGCNEGGVRLPAAGWATSVQHGAATHMQIISQLLAAGEHQRSDDC
jgi:hypothetical protein